LCIVAKVKVKFQYDPITIAEFNFLSSVKSF